MYPKNKKQKKKQSIILGLWVILTYERKVLNDENLNFCLNYQMHMHLLSINGLSKVSKN